MINWKSKIAVIFLIILSAIGFSVEIYAQNDSETKDFSEMSLEDLLNMDVTTVSKSEEKQSDAPGIISVLTKDDLRRFGGMTLMDILERVPGLAPSSVYMTDRAIISPRGDQIQASSAHVLLLLDGRPVRESLEGGIKGEFLMSFPINIIERIEVIKGPGSVLYGSNAFSAVINVITEKPEKTGFSATGIAGDGKALGTQGDLKVKSGDFGLVLAGRLLKMSQWDDRYSVKVPGSPDYSFNFNMPFKGPGAFANLNYKNLNITSSYSRWTNYFLIPDYIPAYNAYGNADWEKIFTNIGYDADINDSWKSSWNVTFTNSWFQVKNFPSIERNSYDLVAELTNFFKLSENSNLTVGGLFNKVDGGETFYGVPGMAIPISDANRIGFGFYSQIDYKLLQNLKGIGGIQINKYQEIDLGFVPRIGFIWYPASRVNVKALYSQAFRAPSINEFSLKHPNLLGDPKLKSEKVGTFDLSISYQGEQLQTAINFFYSKMTDIIYQNRAVTPAVYANGADANSVGFEFEGKYYINKSLYLVGSTLYHNTEDKDGNKNITPIPSFGLKGGISYDFSDAVTMSLFDIYQGGLSDYFNSQINLSPGAYNLLNFYGSINVTKILNLKLNQELFMFAQIDNLLDKEIWLPAWGLTPGNSLPFDPGRTMYLGLTIGM
ncbi:MAG TPA: TonB-dependent receptor [Ignavibacteriaceae bacterium]|nr:TonB-dependent receptor [Ignavibacteriaceae bacterium]